jgi:hypothetical protein
MHALQCNQNATYKVLLRNTILHAIHQLVRVLFQASDDIMLTMHGFLLEKFRWSEGLYKG